MSIITADPATDNTSLTPDWLALVREKVESLRFGVVQLIVHEGRVTQIERTEKTRIANPRERPAD